MRLGVFFTNAWNKFSSRQEDLAEPPERILLFLACELTSRILRDFASATALIDSLKSVSSWSFDLEFGRAE